MKRRMMLLNAGLILIAGIAIVRSLVADPTGLDNQTMQRIIGGFIRIRYDRASV